MARVIPEADFANWLTPRQALEILSAGPGHVGTAMDALVERLMGGLVTAAAEKSVWDGDTNRPKLLEVIDASDWQYFQSHTVFWSHGDGTFKYGYRFTRSQSTTAKYFNVRFDPSDVRKMVPPAVSAPPAPEQQARAPDELRKPVSPANLQAWYDLYQRAYPDELNTEPHALKSAQGMFHDKAVSREAVRKVRGSHKPGPKGKPQD